MPKPRLGDVLRREGTVSEQDLDLVVREQRDHYALLGELLLKKRLVSKQNLAAALEQVTGVPYLDFHGLQVDKQALASISRELALRYHCFPVAQMGRELVLAMAQPQNLGILDELGFRTGLKISPRLSFAADIEKAIAEHYGAGPAPAVEAPAEEPALTDTEGPPPDIEFFTASSRQRAKEAIKEFQAALTSKPTAAVRLVSNIITAAHGKKASDVHIDPQARGTIVRLRVDGILRDLLEVPPHLAGHLVSRIKILADLDIAERRAPQDGRFLVRIREKQLDLRVSTLPTHYGEKVVIRLLDPDSTRVSFRDLGFSEAHSQALAQTFAVPQGLVLVCGPTGSGKTTTLYSALNQLSARSVNIITVEDPIEYMLEGINQVQVNNKAGLSFARCLRSILRQDPNIVLVGEIRDQETAEIALTAAQTGHLVLSTLHTNDSIAVFDRLRDLGVPEFLIASSLTAIISQRLLRKLCMCAVKDDRPDSLCGLLPEWSDFDPPPAAFLPGKCPACENTGYKGRIGAFEVMTVDNEIRRMVLRGAGSNDIRELAAGSGFRFMRDDALQKVISGLTSVEEVLRAVPSVERRSLPCPNCGKDLLAVFAFCPYCGQEQNAPLPFKKTAARGALRG